MCIKLLTQFNGSSFVDNFKASIGSDSLERIEYMSTKIWVDVEGFKLTEVLPVNSMACEITSYGFWKTKNFMEFKITSKSANVFDDGIGMKVERYAKDFRRIFYLKIIA